MSSILVIQAHSEASSFGTALATAYVNGAREAGATVTTLSLVDLDFDPVLRSREPNAQPLEPSLRDARAKIEAATHVVFQFPVWWASLPALLKGFIDRTFLPGWAYQYEDGKPIPKGLLAGRTARVICTMDSPSWWYRLKHRRAAHRTLTHATLHFVGIKKVRETTVFKVRTLDDSARARWVATCRAQGAEDAKWIQG